MEKQTCRRCGEDKIILDFYKADSTCKICRIKLVKEYRAENTNLIKEYEKSRANQPKRVMARKEYAKTERGKKAINRGQKAYQARNPQKNKAHKAVSNAVRDKRLFKQPCEVCGTTVRLHAHHDDYSKPLEVRWLCAMHHHRHHAKDRLAQ